jgi:hypothetical protein
MEKLDFLVAKEYRPLCIERAEKCRVIATGLFPMIYQEEIDD